MRMVGHTGRRVVTMTVIVVAAVNMVVMTMTWVVVGTVAMIAMRMGMDKMIV